MRWLPVTAGYGLSTEWSHGNVDELVGAELPIILDRQEDLLNGPSLSVGAFFLGGGGEIARSGYHSAGLVSAGEHEHQSQIVLLRLRHQQCLLQRRIVRLQLEAFF
jgi:hypothetical protein